MNLLSRKHEYEADRFAALTLRNGKSMEEALINLTVKNLVKPNTASLVFRIPLFAPHPAERIDAIRQCPA